MDFSYPIGKDSAIWSHVTARKSGIWVSCVSREKVK